MVRIFDSSGFQIFRVPDRSVSDTARKLASFKNLPNGWNYGRGRPIRDDVYVLAADLLSFINELSISKTDVFPGSEGDVCIAAYRFAHYLEISIEIDLLVTVSHEVDDIEIFSKADLSPVEAKKELREAVMEIWGLSDLFTRPIMTQLETDSITWHLKTPQMAPALLSSAWSVLTIPDEEFAITSGSSTPEFLESPQSSGNLMNQIYRLDTG